MPTANEDYWNNFNVTDTDVERLYGSVLEQGQPVLASDLARQVVDARVRDEEDRRRRYNAQTTPYQPKLEYQIGQRVIFSELHDAQGEVIAIRPGDNPRLPPFHVITVRFDEDASTREFAAQYDLPHPLNEERAVAVVTSDLSTEQVLAEYGDAIENLLVARLKRDREFVEQRGRWLLRGLLTPVNEYHLNLAEAAIEGENRGLTTTEISRQLDLSAEGPKRTTLFFSIEYALRHDERFVNVGPRGESRWFLTRLVPAEAREIPRLLQLAPAPATSPALPPELETAVQDLEGQADVSAPATAHAGATPIVTVALTYPHRRAGSLPLTSSLSALLPESDNPAMLITLIDAANGNRFQGWVVRAGNYIVGLKPWYDQRKLNPGANIQLQRHSEPLTLVIEYQVQRERSLWVRTARVQGGQLTFTTEKKPVAHKYDEEMLILIADQNALDQLHNTNQANRPLAALLVEIFPELAKLVPGGRIHAKTLFAAVNFAQRVGPRAVFAALAQSSAFVSQGGGYFMMETAGNPVR
ncbi:MAG: hypothetical protein WCF84_17335 [Anaerolineae bacterium]